MLSYQHIYHFGNLADVHKHTTLSIVLKSLIAKDKPLSYIESHSGRGLYDFNAQEIQKTQEAEEGINKLLKMNKIAKDSPYLQALEKIQKIYGKNIYGGSPLIAKTILREEDMLYLMELHPMEYENLKENMKFKNVNIHKRDGYEGILAISPPKIRRGIILIDPSYEVKNEYKQVVDFIEKIQKKWKEASVMLWYPILEEGYYRAMINSLKAKEYQKEWHQEVLFKNHNQRMKGSGIFIINTPYGIERQLNQTTAIFK